MKKFILDLLVCIFVLTKNEVKGQTHYFDATVVNSINCNLTVIFMDGGYNIIYSNNFAPGTINIGCVSGACNWISIIGVGTCTITISCTPSAFDNTYLTTCGACCSPPGIPFNTAYIPPGTFVTYSTLTGCNSVPDDVTDQFTLNLY